MAVVKKFNELLDLEEIDVLIDETGESRHIIVTDLPESVPQGRSSFLVEVSPYMKEGTELQMDFIDSEGESIYLEPVSDYLEGSARRVSMEIYDDTAPGIATLIIVGELESVPDGPSIFSDATPVPDEFQGHYNVRLTKQVIVNSTAVNTQPIKFFTQPKITVFEERKGTMIRTDSTTSLKTDKFNVEGTPTDQNLLFQPYGEIDEELTQGSLSDDGSEAPKPSKQKNVKAFIETKKVKNKKGLRKNSAQKRSGIVTKKNSPITFPYQLKIGTFDGEESFRFNTKHIGGIVRFYPSATGGSFSGQNLFENSEFYSSDSLSVANLTETPSFDITKEIGIENQSPTMYTASIVDLVNNQTALVELPFTNKNENGDNIVLPIFGQGEIEFEALPTGSYADANLISYADIKLSLMRTFSGDVFKVKVYVKSEGGFDDYSLLAEVPLEGKELLTDNDSVGMGERTGYVIKQSEIDKYWTVSGSVNGLIGGATVSDASLTASYNNDVLLDAIRISGSAQNQSDPSNHIRLDLKDQYQFDMKPGIDYTLSANIVGNVDSTNGALLMVYVSGSSMNQQSDLHFNKFTQTDIEEPTPQYGKRLGVLEVDASEETQTDFGLVTSNFTPDVSGSGILQFRVVSGKWYVSDISIQPATDTGFSPNFFEFKQEMPSHLQQKRPDKFEFLVEFYDINNNISDTVVYSPPIPFDGTNLTITGADNTVSGDIFIGGESTSSGIHIGGVESTLPETGEAGAQGSGFI